MTRVMAAIGAPVVRDTAAVRRWMADLPLLGDLEPGDLDVLAAAATWTTMAAGTRMFAPDDAGAGIWLLVDGEVVVGDVPTDPDDGSAPVDGIVRRRITTPGYPLGWDGLLWPGRHRWHAVASTPTRLLHVAADVLRARAAADARFADRFHRWLLWLAGAQVRRQHTRRVTRRYDDETEAVASLIAGRADQLRATSPLHRVPGYLRTRPTVADAFRVLEAVRDGDSRVEAELARDALDLLVGVRRELRVYLALQRVYEAVASADATADPALVRERSCRALVDLFSQTEHRIVGLENLPAQPGSIVVSNHLRSHPDNRLPNDFNLILDTHFVSSMILYRTYGRAPVRVVRDSHWHEVGHARYYARLGYVMVPSSEVAAPPPEQRAARRAQFVREAAAALHAGTDVVICPEGRTGPTEGSPRRLRTGAFMLAGEIRPEPPIVPIALANFDQRLSRTVLGAVVATPFRMSEVVDDPCDRDQVAAFVNDELTPRYRRWVATAATLS